MSQEAKELSTRIYLYGLMGSGKSTIGKLLAERIQYEFIDLDDVIEKENHKTVKEIFESKGETVFRLKETEALISTLELRSHVISTGGGTPVSEINSQILEKAGISIYLKVSTSQLAQRLFPEMLKRPLLQGLSSVEEVHEFLKIMEKKRKKFYKKANFIIDANHSVENIVQEIISKLEIHEEVI